MEFMDRKVENVLSDSLVKFDDVCTLEEFKSLIKGCRSDNLEDKIINFNDRIPSSLKFIIKKIDPLGVYEFIDDSLSEQKENREKDNFILALYSLYTGIRVLERKLENIPSDKLIDPNIRIVGPTLEALKYAYGTKEIRDMYLNLLASSMNIETVTLTHPAYIEIIKQLSPDEAKLLKFLPQKGLYEPTIDITEKRPNRKGTFVFFSNASVLGYDANCELPENTPIYINNLCRLGVCEIPDSYLIEDWRYDKIIKSESYTKIIGSINKDNKHSYVKKMFGITDFGQSLRRICLD